MADTEEELAVTSQFFIPMLTWVTSVRGIMSMP